MLSKNDICYSCRILKMESNPDKTIGDVIDMANYSTDPSQTYCLFYSEIEDAGCCRSCLAKIAHYT